MVSWRIALIAQACSCALWLCCGLLPSPLGSDVVFVMHFFAVWSRLLYSLASVLMGAITFMGSLHIVHSWTKLDIGLAPVVLSQLALHRPGRWPSMSIPLTCNRSCAAWSVLVWLRALHCIHVQWQVVARFLKKTPLQCCSFCLPMVVFSISDCRKL